MEQLWAPWRGEYVTNPSSDGSACFLCDAASVAEADRSTGVVHCAEHSIILLNRYPYSSGHVMVAPKSHGGDITLLDEQVYTCMMRSVRRAVRALNAVYAPHGLNVGMNLGSAAGAGVPDHCHIHVVPRWHGDTNFMPVTGQVRVISESLDDTWSKVCGAIASLGNP